MDREVQSKQIHRGTGLDMRYGGWEVQSQANTQRDGLRYEISGWEVQ